MRTIHKFEIPIASQFAIDMDPFGQIISVQTQRGVPQMWAVVNDEMKQRRREFFIIGTGDEIPNRDLKHIGTFQMEGQHLVWHLFEDMTNVPSLTELLFALAEVKRQG